ncbi:hypothetical protein AWZ03_004595 [Drosophila navojoa]|uniref:Uncharacterized protein n=1 Tax=Drosophila navojoa TaxID=7232 RepID=A0A484BME1_DRONA|nr:hypothetical protein AWZ03_004595 [Drosophila navojoa]
MLQIVELNVEWGWDDWLPQSGYNLAQSQAVRQPGSQVHRQPGYNWPGQQHLFGFASFTWQQHNKQLHSTRTRLRIIGASSRSRSSSRSSSSNSKSRS